MEYEVGCTYYMPMGVRHGQGGEYILYVGQLVGVLGVGYRVWCKACVLCINYVCVVLILRRGH